jgi:hypothetical protein
VRPAPVVAVGVALVAIACGVAPVRERPGPPPTWTYVDPHGRPRAFGGGVCPLQGRHVHGWPPSPRGAFVDDAGAWRDTRRLVTFAGAHALGARRCATPTLHQHALGEDEAGADLSAGSAAARP